MISRARPTHVYKPAEALAIGGGVAGQRGREQTGGFRLCFASLQVVFQETGSRRVPTARASASRLRALRSMRLYWSFLGGGARVRGAGRGSTGCWPRGVTAPTTASPAAAPTLGWSASARWPVLARCPIQASNAGRTASPVPWSTREAKVPGHDPSGTAIQGRGRARLATARAGALRRARPPRRREGFLCVCERGEKELFFKHALL